jgi:hypothetical protein
VVFGLVANESAAKQARLVLITSLAIGRQGSRQAKLGCTFMPILLSIAPGVWGLSPAGSWDRAFASETAQYRAFFPQAYSVAPTYSSLATPWYVDYAHLTFWFFFFSSIVLVLWLVYTVTSLTHHLEARRPVRETRGFSRAQTGDILTAVLPMT